MNTVALSPTAMFQSVGIESGSMLPVAVLILFVILVLPGLARPGTHPEHLSKAAYCYLAQSLGIVLMSAGGLPAVYAVFSREPLSSGTYLGLLFLFAIGGLLLLWHDGMLRSVDEKSKVIPEALFFYSWKFIGLLVTIFATLSYLLQIVVSAGGQAPGWWVVYVVMLTYGLIISWFTIGRTNSASLSHPTFTLVSGIRSATSVKKKPKGKRK